MSTSRDAAVFRAEWRRTEVLLADALELAVNLANERGYSTTCEDVLNVLAERRGIRLERPAHVEEREARVERFASGEPILEQRQAASPEPKLT